MNFDDPVVQYKSLLQAARSLGRAMDLDTLIDEILDKSRDVIGAEASSVLLPDKETGELILYSTHSKVHELDELPRVPPGQGISGYVFQSHEIVNIADAATDSRHYPAINRKLGFEIRAMLSIPLMNGGECLGVMQAVNPIGRKSFSKQSEEVFEGFGGLAVNALLRAEAEIRERERAQSRQELEMAREIQESFLPPVLTQLPFADVHLNYFPARVVSGDFYFVHPLGDHRLLLGLGDVSGKGIPAAITMARATAMIKAVSNQAGDCLGEWVTKLNRQLHDDLRAGRFISITFMLADTKTGNLQVCASGQFSPFHYDGRAWRTEAIEAQLPMGILPDVEYKAVTCPLKPGDFWLLMSDGITEARNAAGQEYSEKGFLRSLPLGQNAKRTIDAAVEGWKKFVGSAGQHDDASLLLLDWTAADPPAEFDTTCCPENLCSCRQFIEQWATRVGYDDVTTGQIIMACDEAASNVFRHAYGGKPGPLRISVQTDGEEFIVRLKDKAGRVDPEKIHGRGLGEIRPGGLGTVIITRVFTRVEYDCGDTGTVLTLAKRLPIGVSPKG